MPRRKKPKLNFIPDIDLHAVKSTPTVPVQPAATAASSSDLLPKSGGLHLPSTAGSTGRIDTQDTPGASHEIGCGSYPLDLPCHGSRSGKTTETPNMSACGVVVGGADAKKIAIRPHHPSRSWPRSYSATNHNTMSLREVIGLTTRIMEELWKNYNGIISFSL